MIKQKFLILGFAYGLIFESFEAETLGFYFLPAMAIILLYQWLPFKFKTVNAVIASAFGFFLMTFWAIAQNGWRGISLKFTLHIFIYVFLLLILLYVFGYAEEK